MNEKENNKMTILYTIKGIQPYTPIKGFVAILLIPVDQIGLDQKPKQNTPNVGMIGMGPDGNMPPEAMAQLQDVFANMMGAKKRSHEDDRHIVLIESEHSFKERDWKYGDLIDGTFQKTE